MGIYHLVSNYSSLCFIRYNLLLEQQCALSYWPIQIVCVGHVSRDPMIPSHMTNQERVLKLVAYCARAQSISQHVDAR